jgi:hypothetical protein
VDADCERLAVVPPFDMYTPERIVEFERASEVDADTRAAAYEELKRADE